MASKLFRVVDATDGLPLWLAHVARLGPAGQVLGGGVTDTQGFVDLSPYSGEPVRVSMVGYSPKVLHGAAALPAPVLVALARGVTLPEVVITPDGPVHPGGGAGDGAGAGDGGGGGGAGTVAAVAAGAFLLLLLFDQD